MNKPMSIVRQEFIESLTGLINESGLPAFVLEPILRDFHSDVKLLAQRQLESDLKNYQSSQGGKG